jgi:BirA family transcriptional regulator, biotin operon repressor / biotin---[acetyl-CoA-carboxylase] ligase
MTPELDPRNVEPRLRGRLGRPYRFLAECGSTQDELRTAGAPEGAVVVADHQTRGRGRSGRSWVDSPGEALLCSVLLRPPPSPDLGQLSLAVGLAVADAVDAATGLDAEIKWPNDVILVGNKVAGVLLEAHGGSVLCGIGVNVAQDARSLPDGGAPPSGSLRSVAGRSSDRVTLLVDLLAALEERYQSWRATGLPGLLGELERRNWLRGRRVRAGARDGTAGSILEDGTLAVALDDGGHLFARSGEVLVGEPHGSPTNPLLHRDEREHRSRPPAGQSPAPADDRSDA